MSVATERPRRFQQSLAIMRLLGGEPPEIIFNTPTGFQLTAADLDAGYVNEKEETPQKKMANTLRGSAALTLSSKIERIPLGVLSYNDETFEPIPEARLVDSETAKIIKRRIKYAFYLIKFEADFFNRNPDEESLYEQCARKLAKFLPPDATSNREKVFASITNEIFTLQIIPGFINLLQHLLEDRPRTSPSDWQIPFCQFRPFVLNSLGIVMHGAKNNLPGLQHYLEQTATGTRFAGYSFHPHNFEIATDHSLGDFPYFARLKPDIASALRKQALTSDVYRTSCPATVHIPPTESALTPQDDLITTIFSKGLM